MSDDIPIAGEIYCGKRGDAREVDEVDFYASGKEYVRWSRPNRQKAIAFECSLITWQKWAKAATKVRGAL